MTGLFVRHWCLHFALLPSDPCYSLDLRQNLADRGNLAVLGHQESKCSRLRPSCWQSTGSASSGGNSQAATREAELPGCQLVEMGEERSQQLFDAACCRPSCWGKHPSLLSALPLPGWRNLQLRVRHRRVLLIPCLETLGVHFGHSSLLLELKPCLHLEFGYSSLESSPRRADGSGEPADLSTHYPRPRAPSSSDFVAFDWTENTALHS